MDDYFDKENNQSSEEMTEITPENTESNTTDASESFAPQANETDATTESSFATGSAETADSQTTTDSIATNAAATDSASTAQTFMSGQQSDGTYRYTANRLPNSTYYYGQNGGNQGGQRYGQTTAGQGYYQNTYNQNNYNQNAYNNGGFQAGYGAPNGAYNANGYTYYNVNGQNVNGANGAQGPVSYVDQPYKRPRGENKGAKKFFKIVAAALIFGIVASATFIGVNKLYSVVNPEEASNVAVNLGSKNGNSELNLDPASGTQLSTTTVAEKVEATSADVSDIVEAAVPSVVIINSTFKTTSYFGEYESSGTASGIIIDKTASELIIATNNHVVENATKVEVVFIDSETYEAQIKGTDADADLAVIAIKLADMKSETLDKIKVATLSTDTVKVGQMAIAIGNALGYGQTTTVGYISAVDREITSDSGTTMQLLQTDAAINEGNSGGALLNIKGEVIGINSAKLVSSAIEGVGFAIPIEKAIDILNDLKSREILEENEKGYLGVTIGTVTDEIAAEYNWPKGVYVSEVTKGYAADLAGIVAGDIIVAVDEKETMKIDDLKGYVNGKRVGSKVTLKVKRLENGEFVDKTIEVTLTTNPALAEETPATVTPAIPESGLDNSTPENGTQTPGTTPGETPEVTPGAGDGSDNYYYGDSWDDLPDEIRDYLKEWGFFGSNP